MAMAPREGRRLRLAGAARLTCAVAAGPGSRPVLVTGDEAGAIRLWDVAAGEALGEPAWAAGPLRALALVELPGTRLLSLTAEGVVEGWELTPGRCMPDGRTRPGLAGVTAVATGAVRGLGAGIFGRLDGSVAIWRLGQQAAAGEPVPGHAGRVLAVASDGAEDALSAGEDGTFCWWSLRVGDRMAQGRLPAPAAALVFARPWPTATVPVAGEDVESRLVGPRDRHRQAFERATGVAMTTGGPGGVVLTAADPRRVLAARAALESLLDGGRVDVDRVRRAAAAAGRRALVPSDDRLLHLRVAVSGTGDGDVVGWSPTNGAEDYRHRGHAGPVTAIAIAAVAGRQVAFTGGADGRVASWDVASGLPDGVELTHDAPIAALAPAGSGVIAVDRDGECTLLTEHGPAAAAGRHGAPVAEALSDTVTVEDHLGHDRLSRAIADFLRNPRTRPPLCIAIRGDWGAGKSSLMASLRERLDPVRDGEPDRVHGRRRQRRMAVAGRAAPRPDALARLVAALRRRLGLPAAPAREGMVVAELRELLRQPPERLEPRPPAPGPARARPARREHLATVWFNPWAYQTGEQLWAGLAHEIISQITDRYPRRERERFFACLNLLRVDRAAVNRRLARLVWEHTSGGLAGAITVVLVPLALVALHALRLAADVGAVVAAPLGAAAAGIGLAAAVSARGVRSEEVNRCLDWLTRGPIHGEHRQAAPGRPGERREEVLLDPRYRDRTGYLHLVESDLRKVLALVASEDTPLVVFVDDLDRCSPAVVTETLEAINLFLAGQFRNCIFVLGIEPLALAAHVDVAYTGLIERLRHRSGAQEEDLAWRFLEKFVQLSVTVPPPTPDGLGRLLDDLLEPAGRGGEPGPNPGAVARAVAGTSAARTLAEAQEVLHAEARADGLAAAAEAAASREIVRRRLESDPGVNEVIRSAVAGLDRRSPRDVKRFLNAFRFYAYLANEQGLLAGDVIEGVRQVALLARLTLRWPQLVGALSARDRTGRPALERLAAAAAGADEGWRAALAGARVAPGAEAPDGAVPLRPLRDLLRAEPRLAAFAASLL